MNQLKGGFVLGKDEKNQNIADDSYNGILLFSPTGTGKGVAVMVPGLLSWQESAIVHDIKGENFKMTSGYRASKGQQIFVWSPLDPNGKTHRFNPLDFVSNIGDVYKIANLIIGNQNDTYAFDARNLLVGLICYIFANPARPRTFGEIVRILSGNFFEELTTNLEQLEAQMEQSGINALLRFLQQDQSVQQAIAAILHSYLEIFSNPLVDNATSSSDFNISDFKNKKTTLYVKLQPSETIMLQSLMQFFYQYALNALTPDQDLLQQKNNHGVMFFMDEFLTIGKMPNLINLVSYVRGYSVKLLLIIQNFEHFKMIYGEDAAKIITHNIHYKISFSTSSKETAEFISSLSNDKISAKEIMSFSHVDQVIIGDGGNIIKSTKNIYYNDNDLKSKILPETILK